MEDCEQDILSGLSQPQKFKVYEWMNEFRLSIDELSAWRKYREVFYKSVKYKVPVETPVDLICRDIYEVKQFGDRVADFFSGNGDLTPVDFCGRRFTQEGVMRWVLIRPYLRQPFSFIMGEPQRVLNSLSSTRSIMPEPGGRGIRKNKRKLSEDFEAVDRELKRKYLNGPSAKNARLDVEGVTQSDARSNTEEERKPSDSMDYAEMVEIYLGHFGVEVQDFSEWLIDSYGSNLVPQDEVFARADILLTSIAEALQALDNYQTRDKSTLASFAENIGVPKASLRKWSSPKMRSLFFMNKTALKYRLFRRVFPIPGHGEESLLAELDEVIYFKGSKELPDLEPGEDPVALVEGILDFYSLDSEVLNELPMECNQGYRERAGGDALRMLLHDLNSVILHLNEVSMCSRHFSPQEVAMIFGKPVGWSPFTKNMYHVSIEDAVGAVRLTRRSRRQLEESGSDPKERVTRNQKIRDLLVKYGSE